MGQCQYWAFTFPVEQCTKSLYLRVATHIFPLYLVMLMVYLVSLTMECYLSASGYKIKHFNLKLHIIIKKKAG